MTVDEQQTYRAAIDHLTEVLAVLDRPGEGLGYAWGLRRGQAGWVYLAKARDQLRALRDEFVAYTLDGKS